jgi:hypothetical protein
MAKKKKLPNGVYILKIKDAELMKLEDKNEEDKKK